MSRDGLIRLSEAKIEGAGKRYGAAWAVKDVSISIGPGELYTLLGPSGSGKTTLLRALAGLITLDAGRIFVDGELVDPLPPWKRNVGMVFARSALWPHMSVFENVAFGLRARGESGGELARKVKAALALVGVEGADGRGSAELGSAEQLRVALARALVVQPRLMLLDDPLSGLDAVPRARMRPELARLLRDVGITAMYATRDHAEAIALSTRIAVLSRGAVMQEGRPDEIYWKPRSRFVAEFVGAANLVSVRVVEQRDVGVVVETAGGARLPVASGGHTWALGDRGLLCLRPEALRVEEAALAPGGIPGTVLSQVFEGARQIYEVDISAATLRVEMLTSALQARTLKPGDDVKVEISPETSVLLRDDRSAEG